jgi:hypothetical protein
MLSRVKMRVGIAWDGNVLLNKGAGVGFQAFGAPGLALILFLRRAANSSSPKSTYKHIQASPLSAISVDRHSE